MTQAVTGTLLHRRSRPANETNRLPAPIEFARPGPNPRRTNCGVRMESSVGKDSAIMDGRSLPGVPLSPDPPTGLVVDHGVLKLIL